eukprot:CAMPEP_0185905014 /NCGR_PEP_ID=MMETSP0196C-20130402/4275_1 /TAXON_ID=2932 /ORGANISM="Alexandrium fundyense, Strain CCMP1719" /LENGTH=105 /DNA_ID=CAMNT_0028624451 /DNA_START=122 /DNA_END=439 /DNA_ORIENTATION=+
MPLSMLSWRPLAGMGELALPLYMTNSMAVLFVNRLLKEYSVPSMGLQGKETLLTAGLPAAWIAGKFIAQLTVMHIIAWMIWKMCSGAAPAQREHAPQSKAAFEGH